MPDTNSFLASARNVLAEKDRLKNSSYSFRKGQKRSFTISYAWLLPATIKTELYFVHIFLSLALTTRSVHFPIDCTANNKP